MRGLVSKLLSLAAVVKGRHFDAAIIVLCVRWYLQYKLSYREHRRDDGERGVSLAPSTILRWCSITLRSSRSAGIASHAKSAGSWRVDETYIEARGRWVYLYRAVDARR